MKIKSRPKPTTDFQPGHPLFQPSLFRYLPLVVLSLLLLNLLATCNNSRMLQQAIKNEPNIYLQTVAGTTLQGKPTDSLYRSDVVVGKFAEDWLKLAFTWKAPPAKEKAFVKERGVEFPYQFDVASQAIIPGYREAYMDSIVQKYQKEFPFRNYVSGQNQSYVRIFEPEETKVRLVEKGVWDITIIATRTHASDKSILAQEIFNHVIRVRAINPAINDQKLWGDKETYLGKLFYEMQRQGLQIIQIDEF